MNCQVCTVRVEKQSGLSESIWQLVIMLHNLHIVDYGLGHPGSVHDTHAFLGTQCRALYSSRLVTQVSEAF